MLAKNHSDRQRLSCLCRLIQMDSPVFSRGHMKSELVLPLKHDTVAADVLHSRLRIASNYHECCAQIASSVAFVPMRDGKLQQIHLVSDILVLEHRSAHHNSRRQRFELAKFLPERVNKGDGGKIRRQIQRQRASLDGLEHVYKHPPAAPVARNLIEE